MKRLNDVIKLQESLLEAEYIAERPLAAALLLFAVFLLADASRPDAD